jgi:hypothetical protein
MDRPQKVAFRNLLYEGSNPSSSNRRAEASRPYPCAQPSMDQSVSMDSGLQKWKKADMPRKSHCEVPKESRMRLWTSFGNGRDLRVLRFQCMGAGRSQRAYFQAFEAALCRSNGDGKTITIEIFNRMPSSSSECRIKSWLERARKAYRPRLRLAVGGCWHCQARPVR